MNKHPNDREYDDYLMERELSRKEGDYELMNRRNGPVDYVYDPLAKGRWFE